jgi:hypothetical protein
MASNYSKRKVNNLKIIMLQMLLYGLLIKRSSQRVVFLAINIKTKAILGPIISTKTVEDSHIIELYSLIIEENNHKPIIIHSYLAP